MNANHKGKAMKRTTATIALLTALGACTATPEMIDAQKGRCSQTGYTEGTIEHAQCVERGTMQQQQTQNAVVGAAAEAAIATALINAFF